MKEFLVIYRSANSSKIIDLNSGSIYFGVLRGKLKKEKVFAGDFVEGEIRGEKFIIERILKRKNVLTRPPLANVDTVFIVMSLRNPNFDTFLLDNFLSVYEHIGIEPVIVINKIDLAKEKSFLKNIENLYQKELGYKTVFVSKNSNLKELKELINGKITILAGASGVGKSTLLSLLSGAKIKTAQVNQKSKKGIHTTTDITLYNFNSSFIADTPGFSKVIATYFIDKKDIRLYFREFLKYRCRFLNCTHTNEPECKVKEAVKKGEINKGRFKNYLKIMKYFCRDIEF
jgi:ribosome biogenesis GTPase